MKDEKFGQWKGLLQDMFREKLRNSLTIEMDTTQVSLVAMNEFMQGTTFEKALKRIV